MPPKGSRGSELTCSLTKTMPLSMSSAAICSPRPRSRVKTPPPSPKAVSLAVAIACSSSLTGTTAADRPKYLLVKGGYSLGYVNQHCRRTISAAAVGDCPPEQTARAPGDAAFDLPVHP